MERIIRLPSDDRTLSVEGVSSDYDLDHLLAVDSPVLDRYYALFSKPLGKKGSGLRQRRLFVGNTRVMQPARITSFADTTFGRIDVNYSLEGYNGVLAFGGGIADTDTLGGQTLKLVRLLNHVDYVAHLPGAVRE